MEYVVLGYERADKYNQVLDLAVREQGGEFRVVVPVWPEGNMSLKDVHYINVDAYRQEHREGKSSIRPVKMNSDGREYLAIRLDKARESAIFRLVSFRESENIYIVQVHIEEFVQSAGRSNEVGDVFYNEDGDMEVEEKYIENLLRKVSILGVTEYSTGETSEYIKDEIEKDLQKGLIHEVIKEAGDSEISLAVTMRQDI